MDRNRGLARLMERWLPVVGYEGRYEVSDQGRVRSLDRVVHLLRLGKPITRRRKGVMLRPGKSEDGYLLVVLHADDGGTTRKVHHLVLEAFIGPRPPGCETLHGLDGPGCNRLDNIRWGTTKENKADSVLQGTAFRPAGEAHHCARLTLTQVCEIRALRGKVSGVRLARRFRVSPATISAIQLEHTWRMARCA